MAVTIQDLPALYRLIDEGWDLDAAARERWLSTLPPEHVRLKQTLNDMLSRRGGVETDLFAKPLSRATATWVDGSDVGGYRLIREIGLGGMGAVWLAEPSNGVLKRQVALKLPLFAIHNKSLAERFDRERDILASLTHPNIARLYDAGTTPTGQPFMALEYVEGLTITEHCDAQKLSIRDRIALFLQVLGAVQHAHSNLVLHRDLKPSNVLVTPDGQVKLLDFGIAKLISSTDVATEESALTQVGGQALTPDYASPEQISGAVITTASDVYSLGVLAYEMLTETKPYRLQRQNLTTLGLAIAAVSVKSASAAAADPKVKQQLKGDIDAILNKALKKDVVERYPTVGAFAEDIERHLAHLPVQAQPDALGYRLRKFVSRNKLAVVTASVTSLSLIVGLSFSIWQARVAHIEAARAEQVKQFIASILTQAVPRQGVGGVVTATDLLSAAAVRIEKELADSPRVAAELGVLIGESFSAFGEPEKGEAPLRAALARAEREYGRQHLVSIRGKFLLTESVNRYDLVEAERLLAELIPDALSGLPATAKYAVDALALRSFAFRKRDNKQESYAAMEQAIALGEKYLGLQHETTIHAIGLFSNIAAGFIDVERQWILASEAMRRATLSVGNKRPHWMLTEIERWYADALTAKGRPSDAVMMLRQVLHDQRSLDGAETLRVRNAISRLARALDRVGSVEALAITREAFAMEARQNLIETEDRSAYGMHLFFTLVNARVVDEALRLDEQMIEVDKRLGINLEHRSFERSIMHARMSAFRGDHDKALRLAEEIAAKAGDKRAAFQAHAWLAAAFSARMQRRSSEGVEFSQRAMAISEKNKLPQHLEASINAALGNALLEKNDYVGAEKLLIQADALYKLAQVQPSVRTADCIIGLARIHLQAGRAAEAKQLVLPLVTVWQVVNPDSEWHGEALYWLARAEAKLGEAQDAQTHRADAIRLLQKSTLPALKRLVQS